MDEETGKPLVDVILDEAQQKGTGKWTSQNALDLGAPTQTINAAVESRIISAYKDERVAASKVLTGPTAPSRAIARQLIRRRAGRPLCRQDLLLRAGHGPAAGRLGRV
jgi:6-phosphogluconate dehydrogenase